MDLGAKQPMQTFDYPDRITRCSDGQYRWSYRLNREQSRFYYRQMIRVCATVAGVITAVAVILFSDMLSREPELWWMMVLPAIGIVGLPALLGHFMMKGGEVNRYEMDETYLRQKNATKGGDAWIRFSKIRELTVDGDVFIIREGITTYRIHVPEADGAFLKEYIESRYH